MKYFMLIVLITVCSISTAWFFAGNGENSGVETVEAGSNVSHHTGARRPVLVELFTSEGCSSCPPADRLLTELQQDGNDHVVTLSFHVDYWNYLGWKDPFSSPVFSKRQEQYARRFKLDSSYTPQMVVNGSAEFVGSQRSKATDAVDGASSEMLGVIDLSLNSGKLSADITGLAAHSGATVYLAVAESGLVTKVRSGENAGANLAHSSVVRQLIPIGKLKAGETGVKMERNIPHNGEWKIENIRYVVFIQENESFKVLAVESVGYQRVS